jgi:nickel-type superoxide dismutase maturation protease
MQSGLSPSNLGEIVLWVFRQRRRFRVTGHSMAPLLKPGDEVLVDPHAYRREPPQPGEIVLAQHPYQTDLRLNELKGDNPSESTDSRAFGGIARHQILGRVTSHFL